MNWLDLFYHELISILSPVQLWSFFFVVSKLVRFLAKMNIKTHKVHYCNLWIGKQKHNVGIWKIDKIWLSKTNFNVKRIFLWMTSNLFEINLSFSNYNFLIILFSKIIATLCQPGALWNPKLIKGNKFPLEYIKFWSTKEETLQPNWH